jgi:hypothetical protein
VSAFFFKMIDMEVYIFLIRCQDCPVSFVI